MLKKAGVVTRHPQPPLVALLLLPLLCGAGSVKTRDGKTLTGDVATADNAVVVRPAVGGEAVTVPWAEVDRVAFRTAPAPDHPVGGASGVLPDGWTSADVGPVARKGSSRCDEKGLFTIEASGWGAWGPDDAFHFVYRPLVGDGQITIHLVRANESQIKMTVGAMIRQDLSPDAPMAGATIHPSGEVRLSRRNPRGSPELRRAEDVAPAPWARLTRSGDTLAAYRSADGKHWELAERRKIEMKPEALVGLAVSTGSNVTLGRVEVDQVTVQQGPPTAAVGAGEDGAAAGGDGAAAGRGQGVVLRDGNVLAGTVLSADAKGVKLSRDGQTQTISRADVAALLFNPGPREADQPGAPARLGVQLTNGDFVDGEVTALTRQAKVGDAKVGRGSVAVTSLLFGAKQFDTDRVVEADLAGVAPAPCKYEVRTADGSVYRANAVEMTAGGVRVDGKDLSDVTQIERR